MGALATAHAMFVTSEFVGVVVALVLAVLAGVLLPAASRRLVRQPVVFLGLHLVARTCSVLVVDQSTGQRIIQLITAWLLAASIARSSFLLVVDVMVAPRLARPLPRIIRDILQAVLYVIILLVALRAIDVEPGSILTTSALLTAAVALSLQDTLGNLVAGLAIQAEHPFDVDDWIQFDDDPKHIGRVLEINWRATKVLTLDEVVVIVPNAALAKAAIVNFTKPTTVSRRSLYVHVPAMVPPHDVQRAILDGLQGCPGVVTVPAPSVVTNAFSNGNVEYWVRFFTDQFHRRDGVDGGARDRVWYALARAGIRIAAPVQAVNMRYVSADTEAADEAARAAESASALASVDFLRALPPHEQEQLAAAARIQIYGEGEVVFRQGELSSQMFIVQRGEVVVQRERGGNQPPLEVARLGRDDFFGEMALMTGDQRTATVRAATPCTLLAIDQAALRAVLAAEPELAELISRVVAERQAASAAAEEDASRVDVEERTSVLLVKIKKFFEL